MTRTTEKPPGDNETTPPTRAAGLSGAQKLTLAATIAALLGTFTGLFDWVADKVTSDPPPEIESRILTADYERAHERFGDYLRDINASTKGLAPIELREEGLLFLIRVQLKGTKGREFPLRWIMYEKSGRRLPRDTYTQTPWDVEPSNEKHASSFAVWTPFPPRPGAYYVRFTLLTDEGVSAAEKITKPFVIKRVPAIG